MKFSKWGGGGGGSEKLTGQQASKRKQASMHTSGHHSDQISRSALRDGATVSTQLCLCIPLFLL